MKVLVIGGCGFIGSHIVDRLLADGHSIRVLDRRAERFRPPLPGVDYVFGSLSDRMTLIEALTGCDVVFHLASTTFPGTANLNPKADVEDNLVGTLGLIETMVDMGIKRMVYLSSGGTVYGMHDSLPIREDQPLLPVGSYGIVKLAIERYLAMFGRTHGLSSVVIRASNPYGPRQAHSGVQGIIGTFLNRLKSGQQIEVWGDGSVVRDYFHVSDLAALCSKAAFSPSEGAFNAGSGEGASVLDLVEMISEVVDQPINPVFLPGRPVDVPHAVLDTSRARETFGWQCKVQLPDGIRQTWDWVKDL